MNNVLFYLLYLLAALVIIILVLSVSISMKNYRIKKVTVGTKDKYYIQKHLLFFWYTCQELQWAGGYEEVCFDTLREAKEYIEKQKEKIDKNKNKKTEYFYY